MSCTGNKHICGDLANDKILRGRQISRFCNKRLASANEQVWLYSMHECSCVNVLNISVKRRLPSAHSNRLV